VYRGKRLSFDGLPHLMGVLNITPDSFYDGGLYISLEKALEKATRLIREGADILDLGGASSRPGTELVPEEVQWERLRPVLRAIRSQWDGWLSVDTYFSGVARKALDEGADMINDISAGKIDPGMKEVIREFRAPCVLMHMRGTPRNMQAEPSYIDLIAEIRVFFEATLREWEGAGVARRQLLVDPGIGFGKTVGHNLSLLKNLTQFAALGRPIVLGTSRKSFIGAVLDRPVEERLPGTLATLAVGAIHGAQVFRVHDVREARDVLQMVHAIQKA